MKRRKTKRKVDSLDFVDDGVEKSNMDLDGEMVAVTTDCEAIFNLSFVPARRELLMVDLKTAIIRSCNVDSFKSRRSRSGSTPPPMIAKFDTFFDLDKVFYLPRPYIVRSTADGSVVWFVHGSVVGYIENGVIGHYAGERSSGFVDGEFWVARFGAIDDLSVSLDGRFAFVSDRSNNRIRCVDRQLKRVFTVAGNGKSLDSDGAALLASLASPDAICVDHHATIPDSVIYFGTTSRIARLQLAETARDVVDYYLTKCSCDRVWHSLIRDLWFVIAEYMVEAAFVTTVMNIDLLVWSMAMLPSRHLLVATSRSIYTLNPVDATKEFITSDSSSPESYAIRSMAVDEATKCVYLNYTNSSLRFLTLPSKYFSISPK